MTHPIQIVEQYWKQGRKTKQTSAGWISGNAVCCIHNNESMDKRGRGGLLVHPDSWSYSCFNCGFTASFKVGRHLSLKARKLLIWMGIPKEEIERINLESIKLRNIETLITDKQRNQVTVNKITFDEINLPSDLEVISDKDFPLEWQYLKERCIGNYPCMVQLKNRIRKHAIVPFTHDGVIVGYSYRYLDNYKPKYLNTSQSGYVFGCDLQHPLWKYAIVVEGIFDALSIDGLAVMHATISDAQAQLLNSLNKEIIVVPDFDEPGMKLIDRALELNYAVSMPDWPTDIKDTNDAVKKIGKLATLITIIAAKETSKVKIELRRRQIAKRL